ncbi:hypothetical protein LCGC14_2383480, partial [marine sediment metagenome]
PEAVGLSMTYTCQHNLLHTRREWEAVLKADWLVSLSKGVGWVDKRTGEKVAGCLIQYVKVNP